MPRLTLHVWLGPLAVAVLVSAAPAYAAIPTHVRVLDHPAKIQVSCCAPAGVVMEAQPGTMLDVLRKDRGWYWVVLPRDGYGTRHSGWVRANDVEPFDAAAAAAAVLAARQDPRAGAPGATSGEGGTPDDRVVITERKDGTTSGAANGTANGTANGAANGAASGAQQFGDVHFDRDRSVLLAGDREILRAAVSALKADPTLVVTIEGHTCNLGSTAYNLALGTRRANAVKEYLVSEGIAGERLHIVSYGEKQPKYDNSREETRKLNRRVAVVPGAKP